MNTVLITGANRGLGLEFCRQYTQSGWNVIACCRSLAHADDLQKLNRENPDINLYELDVSEFDQIDALSERLDDKSIDVLINNAGIYGDDYGHGFGNLDYSTWSRTLAVNTQAPVKMAEAFMPQIKRSDNKMIVTISSQMGSIDDNKGGGNILYRSSKAALNAAMKSLALDLERQSIGVLIFHPGWVKTDMGGPNALIEVDESIEGMIKVIEQFNISQTGSFLKYDGTPLPW